MARPLADIEKIIMAQSPAKKQAWLTLEKEAAEAMKEASEEEIEAFVDSGAGEILDMTCRAIRNIQKNH